MDLSGLARAAKAEPPEPDTFTAQVVRADESGLWVIPLGEDPQHPVGPCRGGWTASGTRVPPGALVMLAETPDGPWVIGYDNPALAIADGTLAPFANPSFEQINTDRTPAGWSDFWQSFNNSQYDWTTEDGTAAQGLRSARFDVFGANPLINSTQWSVPAGSSIEVTIYARGDGIDPRVALYVFSNTPGTDASPFQAGAVQSSATTFLLTEAWLRYRTVFSLPPTHTQVRLFLDPGSDSVTSPLAPAVVWVDNVDADLVELDPAAANQDYLRRASSTLAGGGIRTVTAGGNVSWSQALTIAGAGLNADNAPEGRFEISMPGNGTVIPVHHSATRTSHSVAGGVIGLNPDDALWYELPIGQPALSQPARFHIIGSSAAAAFVVPAHWILIVRRGDWGVSNHAAEYVWGGHQPHDPWRTPAFNSGWIAGTITPRYTKTGDGQVRMKGRVRSGAGSAFTLPTGYRPLEQHQAYVRDGAGAVALVTIASTGVVTTAGNNTDHSIETTFVAEQ